MNVIPTIRVSQTVVAARTGLVIAALRRRDLSLARNSLFIMASTAVSSALGFLFWIVAARLFSAGDVGLAAAVMSAVALAATLASLGLGPALVQLLPRHSSAIERSRTVGAALCAGGLTAVTAGAVLSLVLAVALPHMTRHHAVLVLMAICLVAVPLWTVAALLDQVFVAERTSRFMLVRNASFALVKFSLILLAVLRWSPVLTVILAWLLALLVSVLVGMRLLRLSGRWQWPDASGVVTHLPQMLRASVAHHVITLGGIAPMYLLPLVVTVRLSAAGNAYFYGVWMLCNLAFMVSPAVALSFFAEGSHTSGDLERNLRSSIRIITVLLVPVILVLIAGSIPILALFGPAYARHGQVLLLVLASSAVPDAVTNVYVSILRVQGRLRRAAALNVGAAALVMAVAWVLLPSMGITGAGCAWLIGQVTGSIIAVADMGHVPHVIRRLRSRSARFRRTWERWDTSAPRGGWHGDAIVTDNRIADTVPWPVPAHGRSRHPRVTLRNLAALVRYLGLRVRWRKLDVGLFFVDRGCDIQVGPDARIRFGRHVRFMRDFSGHVNGCLTVGNDVFFNRGCCVVVQDELTIGDNCLFGERVSIHDENHRHAADAEPIAARGYVTAPIVIGDNVWVGANATILQGVRIGSNAVIGANAVVTRDVPACAVAVGVPARVVRCLTSHGDQAGRPV